MSPAATRRDRTPAFGATAKTLAASWVALLLLMSASLAVSYLHLGLGNVVAGLAIACVKTAIVGGWFMHLRSTAATSRAAAAISAFMLAILLALSGVDYLTRLNAPAAVQAPQQIEPLVTRERVTPLP